jgi:hypothetical protein
MLLIKVNYRYSPSFPIGLGRDDSSALNGWTDRRTACPEAKKRRKLFLDKMLDSATQVGQDLPPAARRGASGQAS